MKKLVGLAGVAFFFIALGSLFAITTLMETVEPQWKQWARIAVAFISFVAGFISIEMVMRISTQRFEEAFAKREGELGRPLSPKEREAVKEITHAAMINQGPSFNAPLAQLMARISVIIIPAILLKMIITAGGAFFTGFGVALLFNALTGRVLDDRI